MVGQYELRTRDGAPLPVVISTGDSLLSGSLVVEGDSTFVLNPTYRRGGGTPWTTEISGRLTGPPGALRYLGADGSQIATGAYARGHITFVQQNSYAFTRR